MCVCVCVHIQDYLACSTDLQEVLRLDPSVAEAERELQEVTELLRQSLAAGSPRKSRRSVPITEVRLHLLPHKHTDTQTHTVLGSQCCVK